MHTAVHLQTTVAQNALDLQTTVYFVSCEILAW